MPTHTGGTTGHHTGCTRVMVDPEQRRSHPDPVCRGYDRSFESKVHAAALAGSRVLGRTTLLTTTEREIEYQVVDEVWNTDEGRLAIGRVAQHADTIFAESAMVRAFSEII